MKDLVIIYLACYLWTFLFAKIKINRNSDISIIQRLYVCLFISLISTILIGVPILAIIYLVGI